MIARSLNTELSNKIDEIL